MKNILVIGAGRSAIYLIEYLLEHAEAHNWHITLADANEALAKKRVGNSTRGTALQFDANDAARRIELITDADIVVSMLPAFMHYQVAQDCLALKKNLVTPSYITPEMRNLDAEVAKEGLLFLNELGVDPGIDHMSAMRVLDKIRKSGEITCFESFTGGLVAPESDNNPWNYKFTWNPRNVVLAGQGGAVKFRQNGKYKYIPYHKLFRRTEVIDIEGYGRFEGYANRDSLNYRQVYDLKDIPTIYRGTLRRFGFCRAWDVFVQLGMTDDTYVMENSEHMTHRDFTNSFLAYNPTDSVELKLMHYMKLDQDSEIIEKLKWLGIFDNTPVGLKNATPAQILQSILEKKWSLDPDDKDMLVMWHKFQYKKDGQEYEINSSMVALGEDQEHTAMAKTVGLPLGIAVKMILTGNITSTGVKLPIEKDIYDPILDELEKCGISFTEREFPVTA